MLKNLEFFWGKETSPESSESTSLQISQKISDKFFELLNNPQISFLDFLQNHELLEKTKRVFSKFQKKKHIVLIGIGGSSLGPAMLIEAGKNPNCNRKFYLINNIDSEQFFEVLYQLEQVPLEEILFVVTSKSGGTLETLAGLAIATEWLENWISQKHNITPNNFNQYFVFITDPQKSELLDLGNSRSIDCLEIPLSVGGRFSVLTPVGLLPALFAGINIDDLWAGAQQMAQKIRHFQVDELFKLGNFIYQQAKNGKNQTVFMPYSSKLKTLSDWFVQLWAESLGKEKNVNGTIMSTGLTPIASYGATDQHSQMQLFLEGPNDKILFIIEIENRLHDYSLHSSLEHPKIKAMNHISLNQLMKAEFLGTLEALKIKNRPFVHLKFKQLNAYELGHAIIELEALTLLMSVFLEVDCFNQPSVEIGKTHANNWLALNACE